MSSERNSDNRMTVELPGVGGEEKFSEIKVESCDTRKGSRIDHIVTRDVTATRSAASLGKWLDTISLGPGETRVLHRLTSESRDLAKLEREERRTERSATGAAAAGNRLDRVRAVGGASSSGFNVGVGVEIPSLPLSTTVGWASSRSELAARSTTTFDASGRVREETSAGAVGTTGESTATRQEDDDRSEIRVIRNPSAGDVLNLAVFGVVESWTVTDEVSEVEQILFVEPEDAGKVFGPDDFRGDVGALAESLILDDLASREVDVSSLASIEGSIEPVVRMDVEIECAAGSGKAAISQDFLGRDWVKAETRLLPGVQTVEMSIPNAVDEPAYTPASWRGLDVSGSHPKLGRRITYRVRSVAMFDSDGELLRKLRKVGGAWQELNDPTDPDEQHEHWFVDVELSHSTLTWRANTDVRYYRSLIEAALWQPTGSRVESLRETLATYGSQWHLTDPVRFERFADDGKTGYKVRFDGTPLRPPEPRKERSELRNASSSVMVPMVQPLIGLALDDETKYGPAEPLQVATVLKEAIKPQAPGAATSSPKPSTPPPSYSAGKAPKAESISEGLRTMLLDLVQKGDAGAAGNLLTAVGDALGMDELASVLGAVPQDDGDSTAESSADSSEEGGAKDTTETNQS